MKITSLLILFFTIFFSYHEIRKSNNLIKYQNCDYAKNSFNEIVKWDEKDFPVKIIVDKSVPKEFHKDILKASNEWNKSFNKEVFKIVFSNQYNLNYKIDTNNNYIVFINNIEDLRKSEQARTSVFWKDNLIQRSFIRVNNLDYSYYNESKQVIKGKENQNSDLYSFEALILHELGHVLGLAHSNSEGSVMSEYLSSNTDRVVVSKRDKENINCAYN